jgi:transcriptional regulator with XRE-family HTH domain
VSSEADSEHDVTGQGLVARELRRHRERAGLNLSQLAKRVGYSRTYLSTSEKPGADLVSEEVVKRIDEELDAGGALIELRARADAARKARRASSDLVSRHPGRAGGPSSVMALNFDGNQTAEVPARDSLAPSVVAVLGPAQTLAVLDEVTQSVITRYELEGPQRLMPEVQALHGLCRDLGGRVSGTAERVHLARVGARQTALLAYMSVNLSRHAEAERYTLEASMLATAVDDRPLLAWIKGTQSFAAYYQHRYVEALNLARVGLKLAAGDAQRIRLLANGVARAAGKLGDRTGVDRAVNTALELLDHHSVPAGLTPCIDFGPYGRARTIANAATAYLSVGDYPQALQLTDQLRDTLVESDSDWSRSLVRLDEASALTLSRDADLDRAAAVGMDALSAAAHKPIASVAGRATELAAQLRRRGPYRRGQEFAEALEAWKLREPFT